MAAECWDGSGPVSCLGFAADWLLAHVYWSDQAPDQVRVFIKRPHQVFTRAAPGLAGARGGDPRQITRTSATASLSCEEMNMLALTCSRFINEIFIFIPVYNDLSIFRIFRIFIWYLWCFFIVLWCEEVFVKLRERVSEGLAKGRCCCWCFFGHKVYIRNIKSQYLIS